MTWAAATSLKPEQAWVPWLACLGAEGGGEDVPANEPCSMDLACLRPSAPAHQILVGKSYSIILEDSKQRWAGGSMDDG